MFGRRRKFRNAAKQPRIIPVYPQGFRIYDPRSRGWQAGSANPTSSQAGKQPPKPTFYPKDYPLNDPRSRRWPTSPVNPMNLQTQLHRFMRR
jgi:hypothetical protein